MFTLPDVEVTIQKDLKFNRLRLSCHSYSFKGVHDLFNQKFGFFFNTNFRARSFYPSFIYLLTTWLILQKIILSLFPYRLCPSLNSGVASSFKKGSQRQTKGTSYYLKQLRIQMGGGGEEGATDDARRGYLRTLGKSPSYALVIPCIHYSILINFLRKIDFEKLSLAASNF